MSETVIEHLDWKDTFTVSTDERSWKVKLQHLLEDHPDEVECVAVNKDGSVMYHVPAKWVKIRPPRKVNLTDEQRAARRENMMSLNSLSQSKNSRSD